MSTKIVYADLDLDFGYHPLNFDVSMKFNEYAIARSIRNIVQTNRYERAFHPELGGGIRELLFEPADVITADALETRIKLLILDQEPRCKNVSVQVALSKDESAFDCTVYFTAINNTTPTSIVLYLKRVR